ncbi:hypothetical protein [Actinokineospora spheciospongiae]|uniref:hypothetical protein n=1 Tax=Actinokineospora spheciospongiae TaxID=909613 RepID=UPI000D711785|nr:hypothetical protein [Actinokineospora spheciospongiae]PWW66573.1 hypothetical protein DFQ13_10189 [Actinokineospora spheciospongiae]
MNRTLILASSVVAAVVLSLLPVPVVLRTLVLFPVLILVAGWSAARLVLGTRTPGNDTADDDLRFTLPVLVALLVPLAVVLLLAVFGIPVDTPGIAIGTGAVALLLVGAAHVAAGPPTWPTGLRRTVGPLVAVLVLGGAVAGAAAMRPPVVESYAQLSLSTAVPRAVAGSTVTVPWTLTGYGSPLPEGAPEVRVAVAGQTVTPVEVTGGAVGPSTAAGAVDERRGSVSFAAPTAPGLHDVRVSVGRDPWATLVLRLEVIS